MRGAVAPFPFFTEDAMLELFDDLLYLAWAFVTAWDFETHNDGGRDPPE